jgi:hypothetical protein
MDSDRLFQLFDILGATLSKRCLSLTVPLLAFLRGSIDLWSLIITILLETVSSSHLQVSDRPFASVVLGSLDATGQFRPRPRPLESTP